MKVFRGGTGTTPGPPSSVVALGSFDGFHQADARLAARLVEAGTRAGAAPAVVLFVGSGGSGAQGVERFLKLARLRDRIESLRSAGVEMVVLQRLSRSPLGSESIRSLERRLRELRAVRLILAAETELGTATIRADELAARLGGPLALPIDILAPVEVGGRAVRGAAIRAALADGDLDLAARMLGRRYGVGGRVCHGHHRGKSIGVPTANLRLRGLQMPPDGVYAVRVRVGGRELPGVANLGFNPTFGDTTRSLETHLFDFDEDLYGRWLDVFFVCRLRPECRFSGVDALLRQIHADIAAAREILGSS